MKRFKHTLALLGAAILLTACGADVTHSISINKAIDRCSGNGGVYGITEENHEGRDHMYMNVIAYCNNGAKFFWKDRFPLTERTVRYY